ncbi:MAG: flagellar biosynthesis regulator FlaF [Alphaproteobacteria bacterium]|nr:flagellar biosynthesis regulator FlaF [Alphaproteobacteria bacterium]MBU0797010.1 flagellar biosynthesis regulator FlaF [Alphaproteobacteria bacterium]MBU0886583.1 flagellar biosynthesis regulator FlaF [Alphaproteobacteria bacterium]MBU1814172.1 flagellar biosynthesis regulator FlaF [Alphaproteobacteria bacterium]
MYGYNAYQKVTRVTQTPRAAEHRLLGNVTAALLAADREPDDKRKLVDALLWNKQVWDNLVIEIRDDDNLLPDQLRDSIVGIGTWVMQETYRVMDGDSDVKSLIEINTIIMEGLR